MLGLIPHYLIKVYNRKCEREKLKRGVGPNKGAIQYTSIYIQVNVS